MGGAGRHAFSRASLRLQGPATAQPFQMSIKQLSLNHVKEGIKEEEEEGENED